MSAVRHVAGGLAVLGLPTLLWRLRRLQPQGRALILMYHRVADESDYLGMCVPPTMFAAQIELLCQRARVMRLVDLVERLRDLTPLEEDIAAITFDDGYRDNLNAALPILQHHRVPATVFVTTGFVDGIARPVGERLRDAIGRLWVQGVGSDAWRQGDGTTHQAVRQLLDRRGSLRALRHLAVELKRVPWGEAQGVVAGIEQLAGAPQESRDLMLDWPAVRSLAEQGIEIASHTVSHPILSRLPPREAERELRSSKERIEGEIGHPVAGFAFPNGHREDFTDEHVSLLKRIGYSYACTAEHGVNRPGSDLFRLRRVGIGRDSQVLFDLKLALGGLVQPCAA